MTSRLGKIYNHKKDVLDGTEHKFGVEHFTVDTATLPSSFDLRTQFPSVIPPILDQQSLGCCGGNEISNALRFAVGKEGFTEWQPSRLFIYYFTRLLEGSPIDQDTGISISGGFKSVKKHGTCNEVKWPYIISQFSEKPPLVDDEAALTHIRSFTAMQVQQDLTHMKQVLFSGKNIVIGIQVYESFESDAVAKSGVVPMPDTATEKCLGGHCISLWNYSDADQTFLASNSWGLDWGQQGWFTIPYKYILDPNLASDFWAVGYFK